MVNWKSQQDGFNKGSYANKIQKFGLPTYKFLFKFVENKLIQSGDIYVLRVGS